MWGCFPFGVSWCRTTRVFPTHVGVFPEWDDDPDGCGGLPHACGGVSDSPATAAYDETSSPRMWGCFLMRPFSVEAVFVFPTHVGVFPFFLSLSFFPSSLPHACGGVSPLYNVVLCGIMSSPRMWGCFRENNRTFSEESVFPTHVGVFLILDKALSIGGRLPHACGGVSCLCTGKDDSEKSSPRMWGCFSGRGSRSAR